jgi:hypothetical protein
MDIAGQGSQASLEWRVWPALRRPALTVVLIAFCLLVAWWAIGFMHGAWWGFLTLVVLTVALAEYWFPTRFVLTDSVVRVSGMRRHVERPWSAFRVAVALPDRVVLSPLTKVDSWIARRRSVTLMVSGNRDEVVAFVERHVSVLRG